MDFTKTNIHNPPPLVCDFSKKIFTHLELFYKFENPFVCNCNILTSVTDDEIIFRKTYYSKEKPTVIGSHDPFVQTLTFNLQEICRQFISDVNSVLLNKENNTSISETEDNKT